MKHIITPTATSNAEKKQYLNANGWSERLVADNWISNGAGFVLMKRTTVVAGRYLKAIFCV